MPGVDLQGAEPEDAGSSDWMEDWRRTGGAQVLTAQNVGAEFEEVLVGGRLALQHNVTPFISSAESDRKEDSHFLSALFFSRVFPDIPVVPVVPAARPVPRIPADPRLPLGPRLPSARQSPWAPSPHSLLSEEAGSSDGNGVFQRRRLHDRK